MSVSLMAEGSITEGDGEEVQESAIDPYEEDDPEVLKQREKEYKKTLEVHHDPNLGAEENEAAFQQAVANFCEYLRPEYEKALLKEAKRQMEAYDEDELIERQWIPADEFGAEGDFRSIAIAYSDQREKLTRKIGVPGHPAPALQRWRERKTVEEKKKDWSETPLTMEQVLSAEYETEEDEEEAIIRLLSVKYQSIEKRKKELTEAKADPEAVRKALRASMRKGPPPEIGSMHGTWDVLYHQFPRALNKLPLKVEDGDIIVPTVSGTDTQAWQRNRTIRRIEAKNVDKELIEAESDAPAHRYRLALRKEDVDRCHDFITATVQGLPYVIESNPQQDAPKVQGKKKPAKKKPENKGERDMSAPGAAEAVAKLEAEKAARKKKKAEKAARKEKKKQMLQEKKMQKLIEEEERKAKLAEEEEKKIKGFLPSILKKFGFRKAKEVEEDDDETPPASARPVNITDPADWAETNRDNMPPLLSEDAAENAESVLDAAFATEDTFSNRAKRRAEMYREKLTDEAAKYITQDDLVIRATEGDTNGVAVALLQTDPPLDLNVANDAGLTPLVAAFKTLLSVDASKGDIKGMGSHASKAAAKLNKTLLKDQELVVHLLLFKGADSEVVDMSDQSTGWSILHYAANMGIHERCQQLLKHGVGVDPVDKEGTTPLMEAARMGHLLCADALIMCGAKLDRRDKRGWSALHFAGYYGRTSMCRALLLAGATKSMRNRDLQSPAELALMRKHVRTAQAISTFVKRRIPIKRILLGLEKEIAFKAAASAGSVNSQDGDDDSD